MVVLYESSRQVVSPICSHLVTLHAADLCGIVDKRGRPVKFQPSQMRCEKPSGCLTEGRLRVKFHRNSRVLQCLTSDL